jgi:hypothetical protein
MRKRIAGSILVLAAGLICTAGAHAQRAKRMGKASEQAAPAADPHDLSGVWNMIHPRGVHYLGDTLTAQPPDLTPWGEAEFKKAKASNGGEYTLETSNDPVIEKCYPPGVPRIYLQPFPFQIAQIPGEVLMLFEYDHTVRRIFLNQPIPKDPDPTYMGTSVGHWDGDTLVVDTVGFNENTWLDRLGHAHSEQLHVTERFRRVDQNTIEDQITLTDPKALAQPWKTTLNFGLKPTWHIMEQVCTDNWNFLNFEEKK